MWEKTWGPQDSQKQPKSEKIAKSGHAGFQEGWPDVEGQKLPNFCKTGPKGASNGNALGYFSDLIAELPNFG